MTAQSSLVSSRGAFTIASFCEAHNIGKTSVYAEIKRGRLRAVKMGRKTLIKADDARRFGSPACRPQEQIVPRRDPAYADRR
jgi:excisionase family DNA binding protein